MKTFKITFFRENQQLKNGGYETVREVDTRTKSSALKKAEKLSANCRYGGMRVLMVEEC